MANDRSNVRAGDTPESLKAERENLEQTIASMRQMARDADAMKGQRKSFDAERVADYLQLTRPDMRIRVWAGIRSPEGFQWHKEWMARKKAKAEQSLPKLAAFTQAVILWAEDLERRERQQKATSLASPSEPIVTGGNGVMADAVSYSAPSSNGSPGLETRDSQHDHPETGDQIGRNGEKDEAQEPLNSDHPQTIGEAFGTVMHALGSEIYDTLDGIFHRPYDPVPDNKKSVLDLYKESVQVAQDMDPTTPKGLGHAIFGVGMVAAGEVAAENVSEMRNPASDTEGKLPDAGGPNADEARSAAPKNPKAANTTTPITARPVAQKTTTVQPGSFSILDWSKYPSSIPQPAGPLRLLQGAEYDVARTSANQANAELRATDESLGGWHIHEIQPVKFGGSPTDIGNKMPLPAGAHAEITNWWNALLRDLRGRPDATSK